MPTIYLSPSTQQANLYVTGGSEEYHMNQLADRMEPYLRASGIGFTRNTPDMTAVSSIRQSNAGNYDLHLALHSNAAPEGRYGEVRGSEVYHYPGSVRGERSARDIAEGLRAIYPGTVSVKSTTRLGEVRQPKAPSVATTSTQGLSTRRRRRLTATGASALTSALRGRSRYRLSKGSGSPRR